MSSGSCLQICRRKLGEWRNSRDRVLADVDGALAPDRQPVWLRLVKPRKPDHIVGMLLGVERADHVSPFSRPRDRDRATARTIGQALDWHDLDVLLAGFKALRQD